jgi:hypothetical protein
MNTLVKNIKDCCLRQKRQKNKRIIKQAKRTVQFAKSCAHCVNPTHTGSTWKVEMDSAPPWPRYACCRLHKQKLEFTYMHHMHYVYTRKVIQVTAICYITASKLVHEFQPRSPRFIFLSSSSSFHPSTNSSHLTLPLSFTCLTHRTMLLFSSIIF